MSGSGSTVFGIFTSREAAGKAAEFFHNDRESGRPPLSAHLVKISHGRNRRKIIIIFRKKQFADTGDKYTAKKGRRNN